jgi:hypothetical protein
MSQLRYAPVGMPATQANAAVIPAQPIPRPTNGSTWSSGDSRRDDARSEVRLTPELVVTQAVYRVFGADHPDRVRAVLDYHGLNSRPADRLAMLAARHGVSVRTMTGRIQHLRAELAGVELHPGIVADATRPSTPGEDHLSRLRIATTLHVPAPAAARPAAPAVPAVSPSHLAAGRAAIRLLATVGPLDIDTVFAAIGRCRRFRVRDPLTARDLVAALDCLGATRGNDLLWRAPAAAEVPSRYRSIARAAAGRDLTRQQMIDVLIAAGYTPSSASGRMSSSHPLFERTRHDSYRMIGSPAARSCHLTRRTAVA